MKNSTNNPTDPANSMFNVFFDELVPTEELKNDKAVKTSKFIEQCIWKTDEFGDPDKSALKIDSEVFKIVRQVNSGERT